MGKQGADSIYYMNIITTTQEKPMQKKKKCLEEIKLKH